MEIDDFKSQIGKSKHGCYAHFPGTGPKGAVCRSCAELQIKQRYAEGGKAASAKGVCAKYRALTNQKPTQIHASTSACKYYAQGGTR